MIIIKSMRSTYPSDVFAQLPTGGVLLDIEHKSRIIDV
jgi:hypothetical protein